MSSQRVIRFVFVLFVLGLVLPACGQSTEPSQPSAKAAETPAVSDRDRYCADSDDIQCTDWKSVEIPASVCGVDGTVHLSEGRASVKSPRWPEYELVDVRVFVEDEFGSLVSYGDIDGDDNPEAAVSTWCNNRSGTAGGQLAQERVIFTRSGDDVRALGSVTPQQPIPDDVRSSYIGGVLLAPGRIVAVEAFYGNNDATCCPSGTAMTTWSFRDGRLLPGQAEVLADAVAD
jgi:hypothetical protein